MVVKDAEQDCLVVGVRDEHCGAHHVLEKEHELECLKFHEVKVVGGIFLVPKVFD